MNQAQQPGPSTVEGSEKPQVEAKGSLSPTGPAYRQTMIMGGHRRSISSIKFNPDGTILASGGK